MYKDSIKKSRERQLDKCKVSSWFHFLSPPLTLKQRALMQLIFHEDAFQWEKIRDLFKHSPDGFFVMWLGHFSSFPQVNKCFYILLCLAQDLYERSCVRESSLLNEPLVVNHLCARIYSLHWWKTVNSNFYF